MQVTGAEAGLRAQCRPPCFWEKEKGVQEAVGSKIFFLRGVECPIILKLKCPGSNWTAADSGDCDR